MNTDVQNLNLMACDAKSIFQLSSFWAGYQLRRGREGVDKKFDEIVGATLFMHHQPPLSILCSRYGHKDVNAATAVMVLQLPIFEIWFRFFFTLSNSAQPQGYQRWWCLLRCIYADRMHPYLYF